MDVSVIIPTYNERANIGRLLKEVSSNLANAKLHYEIVVVDDNSQDGTADIVRNIARSTHTKLISRKQKAGIGTAYQAGIRNSCGDIIITMDADLSHDPVVIQSMVEEIRRGNDIVIGSRYTQGGRIESWSLYRRIVSKTANKFAKLVLRLHTNDLTSGYRAYGRNALRKTRFDKLTSTGYSILMETVFRAENARLKIKEIPITFCDRTRSNSKLSNSEKFRYLITVLNLKLGIVQQKIRGMHQ